MKSRVKLKPGQKGTMKLAAQYGDTLFCVRYRYDVEKCRKMKTIEIIVSESDWTPKSPKYKASELVPLRIGINDKTLQDQARAIGGQWDSKQQVWLARYGCIAGTNLEKLIIVKTTKNDKRSKSL
jgi:hypothetical protein